MKLMSRYSRHAWVDEMSIQLHCYVTQGIPTNSKAIASYIPTVTTVAIYQNFGVHLLLAALEDLVKDPAFHIGTQVANEALQAAEILSK